MARVTSDVAASVDHLLTYSLREWEAVASYVQEFPTWDALDQLTFVHEWAIRESALVTLADYDRQDALSHHQQKQYRRLRALVAEHRPAIDRLLQE
jgi:hypothetical protein